MIFSQDIQVRDAMTFMPDFILASCTLDEAILLMHVNHYRHLPILQNGTPIGIVSDRDLKWALSLGTDRRLPVTEFMTSDVYAVPANALIRDVLPRLIEDRLGSALVTDPGGAVIGILTVIDLLDVLRTCLTPGNVNAYG